MSHQARFLGRFTEAANLARAARTGSRGIATPTMTAHFLAMEARALAGVGDRQGTEAVLRQADQLFERPNPDDDPEFIRYVDEAEMAVEASHCYRDLGRSALAIEAAGRAITLSPRSDFFVTMVHAESLILAGDVEQACIVATSALDAGKSLKSTRCVEYVRAFRARLLAIAATTPAAQDLVEHVREHRLWIAAAPGTG